MIFAEKLTVEQADFLHRLEKGACSHAYIIEGPKGSGKRELVTWFAKALLCNSPQRPCGTCLSCRRVENGHHPDVHWYGDGEKAVPIGDVRDLIKETAWIPTEGDKSVFVISAAEKMQPPAQNALLKVFEEPPAGVVIFLLANSGRGLLPTIRSRGQTVRISPPSTEELMSRLQAMYPSATSREISAAVRVGGGSPGEAEAFLQKTASQHRQIAREWLDAAFGMDKYRLLSLVSSSKLKRETALPLVDSFLQMTFDLLLEKNGVEPLLFSDKDGELYGNRATKRVLAQMCDHALACRESLESYGNVTAVMTAFATGLWQAVNG